MFHNYGCGGEHTSKRDAPTARNARRLAKKKVKLKKISANEWEFVYGWEGDVICEKTFIEQSELNLPGSGSEGLPTNPE